MLFYFVLRTTNTNFAGMKHTILLALGSNVLNGEEILAIQINGQLFPDVKRVEIIKECGNILRQE